MIYKTRTFDYTQDWLQCNGTACFIAIAAPQILQWILVVDATILADCRKRKLSEIPYCTNSKSCT